MSLSFSPMIRHQPDHGSTLVILGMLMAAVLIVALSAAFGMGAPDAAAMIVGP
jgi:hypothetical protein